MDDRTRSIMERARLRKAELESEDGKENSHTSSAGDSAFGGSPCTGPLQVNNSPVKNWNQVKETNIDAALKGDQAPPKPRRSAFDALAEEYDHFYNQATSPRKQVTKESVMKGRSPRLSIGETRPSVLCTPAGFAASRSPSKGPHKDDSMHISMKDDSSPLKTRAKIEEEENRRIRFAHPIAATSTFCDDSSLYSASINESSIISGSGVNRSIHSLPSSNRKESTDDGDDLSTDEYGAHLFVKKKTPTKSASSSSMIGSPKPFVRGGSSSQFSHVSFNPSATSSPKVEESVISVDTLLTSEITVTSASTTPTHGRNRRDFLTELEETALAATGGAGTKSIVVSKSIVMSAQKETSKSEMSPIRSAALENAAAKNIAQKFEQKIKTTNTPVPMPKAPIAGVPSEDRDQRTPGSGVKTQWRGATDTPVVVGATPGQPTRPDVRVANIKGLRNRWEFSSITGTPLHPDETEDALVKAAIRMRDTAIPKKVGGRKEQEEEAPKSEPRSETEKHLDDRSATSSPAAKSPRYAPEKSPHKSAFSSPARAPKTAIEAKSPVEQPMEYPESAEVLEESFADNEDSDDGMADKGPNFSKLIDDAFDFMSPSRTPSRPAPLAAAEATPDVLRMESPVNDENDEVADLPSNDEPRKGSGLQYTISYYRKRARQQQESDPTVEKIDLNNTTSSSTPSQQIIGGTSYIESPINLDKIKNQLESTIYTQKMKIHQASKALQLCKNKEQFRGSHEEATAQRAVLVETEVYRAAMNELERLSKNGPVSCDGPTGMISLTHISIDLSRDFVSSYSHIRASSSYYFCVILRSAEKVLHTGIVSSEEAMKKTSIEIIQPLTLKDLPTNFVAMLEVYSFRTIRSQFTHEEKFGLKGATVKHKTMSRGAAPQMSGGGPAAVADTSFQLVGRLALDIHTPSGKKKFALSNVMHPLDGSVTIKMKKQAMGKSTTTHSGFLSMFQKTKEGLGSWNRYWCVLEEGGMKFWKRPEDHTNDKNWLVLLDLQTCAGEKEGANEVNEPCQYMFSFFIDVWVPKEGQEEVESLNRTGRPEMEKLRVNLAADTKEELRSWMQDINQTVKQLLTWNRPFAFAK